MLMCRHNAIMIYFFQIYLFLFKRIVISKVNRNNIKTYNIHKIVDTYTLNFLKS